MLLKSVTEHTATAVAPGKDKVLRICEFKDLLTRTCNQESQCKPSHDDKRSKSAVAVHVGDVLLSSMKERNILKWNPF